MSDPRDTIKQIRETVTDNVLLGRKPEPGEMLALSDEYRALWESGPEDWESSLD